MITLNLNAVGKEQTLIKNYLEQNVSESLANKINAGVKIEKDNKTLLNKKDLSSFMKFANDEARKLAEKGTNCACVEDKTVFGWAIHYFEEDSFEGNLFNEDGTEFKVAPKISTISISATKLTAKNEKKQTSLFDFMDSPTNDSDEIEETDETEEDDENLSYKGQLAKHSQPDLLEDCECEEEVAEDEKTEIQEQPLSENKIINTETGEITTPQTNGTSSIDKEYAIILYNLLDGKLEVKQ